MSSPFDDPMRVFWGALELTDHPYGFEFDADFGAGVNAHEALAGLLADGEVVTSDRTSNRELQFAVWVEAPDLQQAEGPEVALLAEADRPRNELTVYPGNGGTPFVLETFRAQAEHDRAESRERTGMRRFAFTVPARPFARSLTSTLSPIISSTVPPVDPVVVTVDTCDSTAGWTATGDYGAPVAVSHASGYIYNAGYESTVYLMRTGSVDMIGTPYLVVEWHRSKRDLTPVWDPLVLMLPDGGIYPTSTAILDAQWARSVYLLPEAVTPSLQFVSFAGVEQRLHIRDIKRTDQAPAGTATGHQVARTITVGGSARTQAALHMWHDTLSLGDTLLHTSAVTNGMFSCEPFVTSTATPTAGTVAGTGKSLSSPVVYEVPASLFNPDRSTGYLIMSRLQRAGTGAITTKVDPVIGDPFGTGPTAIGGGAENVIRPPAMTQQTIVCLGAFNLPPRRVDGEDAAVRVTITLASPTGTPVLDDLWMVDVETGSLTWINGTGVGVDSNLVFGHVWVEPPSLDAPLPRVRTAYDANGRFGYEMTPSSMGRHEFPPGDVHVYTVSTGSTESKIQLEYFERWLFHARG